MVVAISTMGLVGGSSILFTLESTTARVLALLFLSAGFVTVTCPRKKRSVDSRT